MSVECDECEDGAIGAGAAADPSRSATAYSGSTETALADRESDRGVAND